jgi:hypothetical protein
LRTDAYGRYFVTGLPIGTYQLSYERCPTEATSQQPAPNVLLQAVMPTRAASVVAGVLRRVPEVVLPAAPVTVGRDGRMTLSELLGRPVSVHPVSAGEQAGADKGAISGRVTNLQGRPIGGICAIAFTRRGYGIADATGTDGTYLIPLRAGSYFVAFEPGCGTTDNWYPTEYDNGALVVVTGGQTTSGIDVQLGLGGGLSGTVTDTKGHPLTNVCVFAVRITRNSLSLYEEFGLAPGGTFELASIQPGPWTLSFEGCGSNYALQFWKDATSYKDATVIDVPPGPTVTGIDAALSVGGKITGTVSNAAGKGLAGICASVIVPVARGVTSESFYRSHTGGGYGIGDLDSGSYRPQFSTGCNNRGNGNYAPTAAPDKIAFVTGEVTSGANVTMLPGASIYGTVTDSSGAPLAGICVVLGSSQPLFTQPAVTSLKGRYRIDGLPAGGYGIEFTTGCGNEGNYITQFYKNQISPSEYTLITLATGSSATGINAAMQTGGVLRGTITAAGGGAIAKACVVTSPVEYGFVGPAIEGGFFAYFGTQTRTNGEFTISGLPTGPYVVYIDPTCDGELSSSSSAMYYGGGNEYPPAQVVSVTAGSTTVDIDASLPAAGTISGTVSPQVPGCIYLLDPTTDAVIYQLFLALGPSGSYDLQGVLPGSYLVAFSQCSVVATTAPQFYPNASTTTQAQAVEVTGGETTSGIDFNLPATAEITGHVTSPTGGNAEVCILALNQPATAGLGGVAFSDRAGNYVLEGIGTGDYTLQFGACGRPVTAAVTLVENVSATDGSVTSGVNASLPAAGAVSGSVSSASGSPLGGVCVYAAGAPGGIAANETETLPDGTYELPGLPAGAWQLTFQPDCGVYGTWSTESTPAPINVVAGGTTTGVDATLAPGGSIFGLVSVPGGHDLAKICVIAWPVSGGQPSDLATSARGQYTIVGLQPGQYDVEFTNGCGNTTSYVTQWWDDAATQAAATPVTVKSGQATIGVDATLTPSS